MLIPFLLRLAELALGLLADCDSALLQGSISAVFVSFLAIYLPSLELGVGI